jgi:cullin-associated NEDD8-dissociated protein 1
MSDAKYRKLIDTVARNVDAQEREMAIYDLTKMAKEAGTVNRNMANQLRDIIFKTMTVDVNQDTKAAACAFVASCHQCFDAKSIEVLLRDLGNFISAPIVITASKYGGADVRELTQKLNTKREIGHAIKAVVSESSTELTTTVAPQLIRQLMDVLDAKTPANQTSFDVELVCLDIIRSVLSTCGSALSASDLTRIQRRTLALLDHKEENLRRSAGSTLGPFVQCLEDETFQSVIDTLTANMRRSQYRVTYVSCIGVVSESAGNRISGSLSTIIDILLAYFTNTSREQKEETLDLWEESLKTIGSIITRCPAGLSHSTFDQIVHVAIQMTKHDPGYIAASEQNDAYDDDSDDEFTSGDASAFAAAGYGSSSTSVKTSDLTWKVRREGTNLIGVVASVRNDVLKENFQVIMETIQGRFTEREPICKAVVFNTMSSLVRESNGGGGDNSELAQPTLMRQTSIEMMIIPQISNIVWGSCSQFESSNVDGKAAIMSLLAEIANICSGENEQYEFANSFELVIPAVCQGISSDTKDSSVLASESLRCLRALSTRFDASYFKAEGEEEEKQYYYQILACLGECISAGGTVVPEALKTLELFAQYVVWDATYENAIWLCDLVLQQFQLSDVDENLKLTSIRAMSVLFSVYGDMLSEKLPEVLPVFVERMGNLTTANACAQGLTLIASTESSLDLSVFVQNHISVLCSYLRKSIPQLPSNGAQCIAALVRRDGKKMKSAGVRTCMSEVAAHINDSNLTLTAHALDVVSALLEHAPGASALVAGEPLRAALRLAKSPYVGGTALLSLANFFRVCVSSSSRERTLTFQALDTALKGCSDSKSPKSIQPVSKCLATILGAASSSEQKTAINKYISEVKNGQRKPHAAQVALYTLGEFGSTTDLSAYSNLEGAILSVWSQDNTANREAAATAMGLITAGDLTKVHSLLSLAASTNDLYLSLSALRSTLQVVGEWESFEYYDDYVSETLNTLTRYVSESDDAVRGLVSECLGRLCVIAPNRVIAVVAQLATDRKQSISQRAVAVNALKSSISDRLHYDFLTIELRPLCGMLDISERDELPLKAIFVEFISALILANANAIDRALMQEVVLPKLYLETKVYSDRIEEVDYIAFKEDKDHGLPVRRSVFKCLSNIVDHIPRYVDMKEFVTNIKAGLSDKNEIQSVALELLLQLSKRSPNIVLEFLSDLFITIKKALIASIKVLKSSTNDKKKLDDAIEYMSATVKAVWIFNKLPGAAHIPKFQQLISQIKGQGKKVPRIREIIHAVETELGQ